MTSNSDSDTPKDLCEECKTVKFKYKCPACSRRTCSLPCVNSHKKVTGCSGKKDPTAFLPLSQFTDSTLLADYNLLEDVKRIAESSQRMRTQLCAYYQHRLPKYLNALQGAASKRRTSLMFYPPGMSKRQKNQTRYTLRSKFIKWTIEWRFHSTDVALLEHMVHENSTLRLVIEKHLQPSPWRNKLRRFIEEPLDTLKFLIHQNEKNPNSQYHELDIDTPLRQLFSGLAILEYPVIHVFHPSDPCNFKTIKGVKRTPIQPKSKEPVKDDRSVNSSKEEEIVELTPLVIRSKEEEIVEDEATEPKIFDFLDKSIRELTSPLRGHASSTEAKDVRLSTEVEMLQMSIGEFDFDQELIDAYSLLLEEGNPNDFLDYNPNPVCGLGDHENSLTDLYFADMEELEEGEIPDTE